MDNLGDHHIVAMLPRMIRGIYVERLFGSSINEFKFVLITQGCDHRTIPRMIIGGIKNRENESNRRILTMMEIEIAMKKNFAYFL